ncbi:unnamed protein product, partial [Brassica rapa]
SPLPDCNPETRFRLQFSSHRPPLSRSSVLCPSSNLFFSLISVRKSI